MQSVNDVLASMLRRLNNLSVPREESPSLESRNAFQSQLKEIFFEAVMTIDRNSLAALKRKGGLYWGPDQLARQAQRAGVQVFTRNLHAAASHEIKNMPSQLLNDTLDVITNLNFSTIRENPHIFFTTLYTYLRQYLKEYPKEASSQQKLDIDLKNKKIMQFLLYALNSFLINGIVNTMYVMYRYPTLMSYFLYMLFFVANILLALEVVIPILFFIAIELLKVPEELILNYATDGCYLDVVEKQACINLGRQQMSLEAVSTPDAMLESPTDAEAYEIGARILEEKVRNDEGGFNRRFICKKNANDIGFQHIHYVFASISSRLSSLGIASAMILGLCISLPLVVTEKLVWVAICVGVLPLFLVSLVLRLLLSVVLAMPFYLYDAGLFLTRGNIIGENTPAIDKFCLDCVWSIKFFAKPSVQSAVELSLLNRGTSQPIVI